MNNPKVILLFILLLIIVSFGGLFLLPFLAWLIDDCDFVLYLIEAILLMLFFILLLMVIIPVIKTGITKKQHNKVTFDIKRSEFNNNQLSGKAIFALLISASLGGLIVPFASFFDGKYEGCKKWGDCLVRPDYGPCYSKFGIEKIPHVTASYFFLAKNPKGEDNIVTVSFDECDDDWCNEKTERGFEQLGQLQTRIYDKFGSLIDSFGPGNNLGYRCFDRTEYYGKSIIYIYDDVVFTDEKDMMISFLESNDYKVK